MADYTIRAHPGKAGYHQHVYPGGRVVVVKGAHHSAAEGGGGAAAGGGAGNVSGVTGAPPLDPELEARRASTKQQLDIGALQDAYDTRKTSEAYGIDNTSDPFSRARMLEKSYHQAQRVTTNTMAAKGQLYSGALQTGLQEKGSDYAKSSADLKRAYDEAISNIQKRKIDRYGAAGQTIDEATYQSLVKQLTS